jgi:hypothetical protein
MSYAADDIFAIFTIRTFFTQIKDNQDYTFLESVQITQALAALINCQ